MLEALKSLEFGVCFFCPGGSLEVWEFGSVEVCMFGRFGILDVWSVGSLPKQPST